MSRKVCASEGCNQYTYNEFCRKHNGNKCLKCGAGCRGEYCYKHNEVAKQNNREKAKRHRAKCSVLKLSLLPQCTNTPVDEVKEHGVISACQ